jgi:transcriptional regulator of acetoin/glycerol metabolism
VDDVDPGHRLQQLAPEVIGVPLPGGVSPTEAFGEKTSPFDLHETERRLIVQALAATNGNITAAAKKLGISRRTLHRKINEMNLSKKSAQVADAKYGSAAK